MADVSKLQLVLGGDATQLLAALDHAKKASSTFRKETEGHFSAITNAAKGMVNGLGAIGLAAGGLSALASSAKGAADAFGIGLNVEMENVKAKLVAFTKDGAKAEQILKDIKAEASTTPFAFKEMAAATASLMPVAKQSGAALMDLVKQAEILAASNPEQGLEGAAVALREAAGGDFVSVIERFNLSRQTLNKLKEQGVPALKAVSMAMKEMGFDADLVSGLANTASGRWSTLMDTFDTLRAAVSKPLFEILSNGLVDIQGALDAAMPKLEVFATIMGEGIAAFFTGSGFDKWYDNMVKALGPEAAGMIAAVIDPLARVRAAINDFLSGDVAAGWEKLSGAAQGALTLIENAMGALMTWISDNIGTIIGKLGEWTAAFIGWVTPAIPAMLERARELLERLGGWIAEAAPPILERFEKEWIPAAIAWVSGVSGKLINENLPDMLNKLTDWIVQKGAPALLTASAALGKAIVAGIWNGIMRDWPTLLENMKLLNPFGTLTDIVTNAVMDRLRGGPKGRLLLPNYDDERDPTKIAVEDMTAAALDAMDAVGHPLPNSPFGNTLADALNESLAKVKAFDDANAARVKQDIANNLSDRASGALAAFQSTLTDPFDADAFQRSQFGSTRSERMAEAAAGTAQMERGAARNARRARRRVDQQAARDAERQRYALTALRARIAGMGDYNPDMGGLLAGSLEAQIGQRASRDPRLADMLDRLTNLLDGGLQVNMNGTVVGRIISKDVSDRGDLLQRMGGIPR